MAFLNDDILDAALTELDTATIIHICSAAPSSYANVASVTLGNKNFGAGGCFGAPANGGTSGRKVATTAITDGTVTGTGTATHWAAVDGTRLLCWQTLSSSQAVTSGNTFTLSSTDVTFPDPA
jgi:hypothetical protein